MRINSVILVPKCETSLLQLVDSLRLRRIREVLLQPETAEACHSEELKGEGLRAEEEVIMICL
jgi:hypothetical protein